MKTQYTIRNVPKDIDAQLRAISTRQKRSLNTVIIDQLQNSLKKTPTKPVKKINHDFDDLIGKWQPDPEFDRLLAEQRVVDPRDWP